MRLVLAETCQGFVDGYWRLRRAIGRDRPLGRHHVAAVLLLAKSRDLEYRDLELPHAYPAELIARFLTLAATHRLDTEDERLLWDVLTATGHLIDYEPIRPWMEFPIVRRRLSCRQVHPCSRRSRSTIR